MERKFVRRKAPEKFVNWDKNTFLRLISASPERLTSRFQVTHGMLLNVLSREGDGCAAMQKLIRDSHESDKAKEAHRRRAWQLFRSLADRKIIEIIPASERGPGDSAKLRVNVELQDDFSMDQTLSLYLLETIPLLDPEAPDYALVLLTLVESILEDPDIILRKQLDKVKSQKMAEMKMAGIEYDERIEELEKLEHPKPNREFVYSTFNAFADRHPWVGQENIRPKSIVREMFEEFRSFADYIKIYELQRAEGVLLRHLNSVFKVLAQTVPDTAKNEQLQEMELYLSTMIRQVDSSLLDEWERMRDPNFQRADAKEVRPPGAEEAERDITRDTKAFTSAIRNRIFVFLRGLVNGEFEAALSSLAEGSSSEGRVTEGRVTRVPIIDADQGLSELVPPKLENQGLSELVPPADWTSERLAQAVEAYHADHERICLDPNARNIRHTYVVPAEDKKTWRVQQMLVDPEEHNDWVAEFEVDLKESRVKEEPVVRFLRLGALSDGFHRR